MIYVFLANGFEEIEAIAPIDILRRADFDVKTVGVGGKTVTSARGIPVICDAEESEITPESIQAIVLPGGGTGTENLEASEIVQTFINAASKANALICAICAAPSILGHKGLLAGKNCTAFPTFQKELKGGIISTEPVVKDGSIITAEGAGVSCDFALKIVEALAGKEKSENLRGTMRFK